MVDKNSHSKSFSVLVPFSPINRPKSNSIVKQLNEIVAQNKVRQQNIQYQRLLIHSKQLEIIMEERKAIVDRLVRERKRNEKEINDSMLKMQRSQSQLKQKQCYLERYYNQLDKKFRKGLQDKFVSLKKLQQDLYQLYQRDQNRLREGLVGQQEQYERIRSLVQSQKISRQSLFTRLTDLEMKRQMSANSSEVLQRKQMIRQNEYLRNEVQRLTKQKKSLEFQERNLKKVLNVEQQHKKQSTIITTTMKKFFTIKMKEQRYKIAVSQDYAKNMSGLRDIVSRTSIERNKLLGDLREKKAMLEQLKKENSQKNKEYSLLEDEHIRNYKK